jgi:hypothetical protein
MRGRSLTLRAGGLVATGALCVHELRFLIAGDAAAGEQAGHGYLPLLGLVSVVLLAACAGRLASRLERARRTGRADAAGLPFVRAWIGLALAVALVFCAQELLESALTVDRAAGLSGALGGGGWIAFPLSLAVSAVLALGLTGARRALRAAARAARTLTSSRRTSSRGAPPALLPPLAGVLARNLAGRAPPASC